MSSPYRPRSSPSRAPANGVHSTHRNGQMETQTSLLFEDMSWLYMDDDRIFKRKLDEETLRQRQRHVEGLEQALAKHEAVRRSAEQKCEAVQLEAERKRIAEEAERQRRLEEERRKLAEAQEAEFQRIEREKRKEQERRVQEEQRERERIAAAEREEARKREEADAQARQKAADEKAELDQKARDEAAAREALQQQHQAQPAQPSVTQPNGATPGAPLRTTNSNTVAMPAQGLVSDEAERLRVHNAYLQIHARLKELRAEIKRIKAQDPQMYEEIRSHQQDVNKILGQLVKHDNAANRVKINTLKERHWEWSKLRAPNETVDINLFRLDPLQQPLQVPKLFVWMINCTCKAIIRQMCVECAAEASFAEPLGILTAMIFSQQEFRPEGHAMVDIFWAKFHKAHPVLMGCPGSEQTPADRERLGWRQDWSRDEAFGRFRGMSRGFAAITLRDFSKAKHENPFPNRIFWTALSRILNTPGERQLAIQYLSLEGLLDHIFVPRLLQLYGNSGLAALRTATKVFPRRRDPNKKTIGQLAAAISSLPDRYQNELNLKL